MFINPDLAIDKHKYAENLSSLDSCIGLMPLILKMSYVLTSKIYCHGIQMLTCMPWGSCKVGKTNLYGDRSEDSAVVVLIF